MRQSAVEHFAPACLEGRRPAGVIAMLEAQVEENPWRKKAVPCWPWPA